MKNQREKKTAWVFAAALALILGVLLTAALKTAAYNRARHRETFSGPALFLPGDAPEIEVSVIGAARSSTWTKTFDLYGEGITEPNFQAFTYDFTVFNNTKDAVNDFTFQLSFSRDVYLMSAWNGALEIHQHDGGDEIVDTIPDLREFDPADYVLKTVIFDGEPLVAMRAGDYLVYHPSSSLNAMEIPIEAYEATTPGVILYVAIGESIDSSTLTLDYSFHRLLTGEPLFWIAVGLLLIWLLALASFGLSAAQIMKYQRRHERDNKIISESIETFTGFIDAKDPYTNGHSKRVGIYTRRIAQEFGYEGEELDRIYYIALLHDCGKIGVPDSILGKPERLNDEEYKILKTHARRGGEILGSFKSLEGVGEGALYHHERYDGKGYPEGLLGEEIPFIARLICVADSFDAMNTDRVYRKKLSKERILHEIEANKGLQFDPRVADVMLRLLREGEIPVGN